MASLRPSAFNQKMRSDGGPFLSFEHLDTELCPDPNESEPFAVDIYYSDVDPNTITETSQHGWVRILSIRADLLTIFPVGHRANKSDYGLPKYGTIDRIVLAPPVAGPYKIPTSEAALDDFLLQLPDGLSKDWRTGLGFLWEYRSIGELLGTTLGVEILCLHGSSKIDTPSSFDGFVYTLGLKRFHDVRRELNRITRQHQREALQQKKLLISNNLLNQVDPATFPRIEEKITPNAIAELVKRTKGELSSRDRKAAVKVVSEHVQTLAKTEPTALLQLKQDIELVTLRELIDRCNNMLGTSTKEETWQQFLAANPFILSMAFHYAMVLIGERPYLGGKSLMGVGGNYGDFLLHSASTGNLALIEIKRPGTQLMVSYRGENYAPSAELSGAISQVLAQKSTLVTQFSVLRDGLPDGLRPHSVECVVIAGTTPSDSAQVRSLELYRNAMSKVTIITFDELVGRLEAIHTLLSEKERRPHTALESDDLPF